MAAEIDEAADAPDAEVESEPSAPESAEPLAA
jgi:hypothetical protein